MRNAAIPAVMPDTGVIEQDRAISTGKETKPNLKLVEKRKTGTRIKAVLWVALIFAAFFLVISRYSNLTELNYETADIKNKLEQQNSINSALSVELDKKTNTMMIKHSAETELGMQEPNNFQIVYINVPRSNTAVLDVPADNKADETIGILENLKAFIVGN